MNKKGNIKLIRKKKVGEKNKKKSEKIHGRMLAAPPTQRFRTGASEKRHLQWLTQGVDQDMRN